MTPFLQLAIVLAIVLLAAKAAGYISIRLGQPSVLGELLMGVLLGPSLINLLHLPGLSNVQMEEMIHQLGEIGVLLLMFIAGLELHLSELRRNLRSSALAGIMGVALPFLLGWGTGLLFNLSQPEAIFLGLTLGATSVSISAQTLIELRVLKSKVGFGLLGAAVFDDVLVILLLSIFFAIIPSTGSVGGLAQIALVFGRIVVYFLIAFILGRWVLPRLVRWVSSLPVSQNILSLAIVTVLVYALAAELIGGMAAITGAFLAGLMFSRLPERDDLEPRISAIAYGFFVPIFFVSIGLSVNIASAATGLGLAASLILVAIVGKWIGAGLGARWGGFTWKEAWQLGAGMISRGEVGLIIANVGLRTGLVNETEFAAIVGMVIISTIVTPPILRYLIKKPAVKPKIEIPVQAETEADPSSPPPAGDNTNPAEISNQPAESGIPEEPQA